MNKKNEFINLNVLPPDFKSEIDRQSKTKTSVCFHCLTCSGGCPFAELMDYQPHQINRLVQLGMKAEALRSSAIWICVGCHTCSVQCPQNVNIPAIMDSLRHMAIKEGYKIGEPDILNFHNEVVDSIKKYGRTHKLEIMIRYKLARKDFFSDMEVGLKMLLKRKLDLTPSKIKDINDLNKIFVKK